MKNLILIVFSFILFSFNAQSFSWDSIKISSVIIDTNNSLQVTVKNSSIDIISYPGFVLFNPNADTMAKEIVNYFGCGQGYIKK